MYESITRRIVETPMSDASSQPEAQSIQRQLGDLQKKLADVESEPIKQIEAINRVRLLNQWIDWELGGKRDANIYKSFYGPPPYSDLKAFSDAFSAYEKFSHDFDLMNAEIVRFDIHLQRSIAVLSEVALRKKVYESARSICSSIFDGPYDFELKVEYHDRPYSSFHPEKMLISIGDFVADTNGISVQRLINSILQLLHEIAHVCHFVKMKSNNSCFLEWDKVSLLTNFHAEGLAETIARDNVIGCFGTILDEHLEADSADLSTFAHGLLEKQREVKKIEADLRKTLQLEIVQCDHGSPEAIASIISDFLCTCNFSEESGVGESFIENIFTNLDNPIGLLTDINYAAVQEEFAAVTATIDRQRLLSSTLCLPTLLSLVKSGDF